jgi:chromosome segregation ATPase
MSGGQTEARELERRVRSDDEEIKRLQRVIDTERQALTRNVSSERAQLEQQLTTEQAALERAEALRREVCVWRTCTRGPMLIMGDGITPE